MSSTMLARGWIEFIKKARRNKGNLMLLEEFGKQMVATGEDHKFDMITVGLHNEATNEVRDKRKREGRRPDSRISD